MALSTSRASRRPCAPEGFSRARSMPACAARRRASGLTATPLASRAGPKLRSGVRTSRNGSSGTARAGAGEGAAAAVGARAGAAGAFGAGDGAVADGAGIGFTAAPLPAITATTAPTGATSPAATRTSASTPASVAGTSIDTLSVSISNRLSPGATLSPACLNHLVTLPSATVSPSCGIRTSINPILFHPLPHHFLRGADRPQDQPVALEFIGPHILGERSRLHAGDAMVRHRAGTLVERPCAEIGDVVGKRRLRLLGGRRRARHRVDAVGRDLRRHLAARGVEDVALGVGAAVRPWPAVDPGAGVAPDADEALGGLARHRLALRLCHDAQREHEREQRNAPAHVLTTSPRRTASP